MFGVINVYMMVIGMIIVCMVKEYINGLMVKDMKENMNLIRNVDMVYIIIWMEEGFLDNGWMVFNREKVVCKIMKGELEKENGRMVK